MPQVVNEKGYPQSGGPGFSAFYETRTADPGNRSDCEFIYTKSTLDYDDISSGTGSATHQANSRDILLAVGGTGTGATGGIRKHYWVPYTPGNGQEIDISGVLDYANIGGGTAYTFIRSTVTGSTVVEKTPQSDWLAAASNVNWQYSRFFRMTFQSLKVGNIQFWLLHNGELVKVDEIVNDNIRNTGFWQYPSLPSYWKVYNDGTNTVSEIGYGDELNGIGFMYVFDGTKTGAQAVAICETVKSQGGQSLFDIPGKPFSTPIPSAKTVSTSLIPILSIRVAATLNSLANRELVIPESFRVNTNNAIDFSVLYRPTLTGASWVAVNATHSGVEYDITASAITGGINILSESISSGVNVPAFTSNILGKTIMSLGSGTSDILAIAAIRAGSVDASVKSYFRWREIR